jgi:hypothetical protein
MHLLQLCPRKARRLADGLYMGAHNLSPEEVAGMEAKYWQEEHCDG